MKTEWRGYRFPLCIVALSAGCHLVAATAGESEVYQVMPSPVIAVAVEDESVPMPAQRPALSKTEQWLQLQVSGDAASPNMQSATPYERELANRRLLESYRHPIPDFYDREAGGEVRR